MCSGECDSEYVTPAACGIREFIGKLTEEL